MKVARLRPPCLWVLSLVAILVATASPASATAVAITTDPSAFGGLTRDDPFSLQMQATGSGVSYAWSVDSGTLPDGLSMSSAGVITGAPTKKQARTVTFRATVVPTQISGTRTYTLSVYGVPKPEPIDIPYTLGAIYMPRPSWPSHIWGDLRLLDEKNGIKATKGQRYPLLGFYQGDSPEVLDWQIKMAADRGITSFWFHDYWVENFDTPLYDTSVGAFLASRYRDRMSFSVVLNACRTVLLTDAAKRACVLNKALPYYVSHYFNQPNYLRIDDRPVLQILNLSATIGTVPTEIKAFMQQADAYVAQHTPYGGVYWVTWDIADASPSYTFANVADRKFDAVATGTILPYLFPAPSWSNFPIAHPDWPNPDPAWEPGLVYKTAVDGGLVLQQRNFEQARLSGIKYLASVTPDIDTRWIFWATQHLYYSAQTPGHYAFQVASIRDLVQAYPDALPVSSNTGKPIVGLGSWNEQGESSSIEPGLSVFALTAQQGVYAPYFIANTIANAFGGSGTYDAYVPDLADIPHHEFPNKTQWAFSTATGAGLDEWATAAAAGLEIGSDDDLRITGIHQENEPIMIETPVYRTLTANQKVRIRLRRIGTSVPADIAVWGLSSTYPADAWTFGSAQVPGQAYARPGSLSATIPAANGYTDYVFNMPSEAPGDALRMLQIRFYRPTAETGVYSVKGVWLE